MYHGCVVAKDLPGQAGWDDRGREPYGSTRDPKHDDIGLIRLHWHCGPHWKPTTASRAWPDDNHLPSSWVKVISIV
jgi:hypothetical protein